MYKELELAVCTMAVVNKATACGLRFQERLTGLGVTSYNSSDQTIAYVFAALHCLQGPWQSILGKNLLVYQNISYQDNTERCSMDLQVLCSSYPVHSV
jgi:hypothetical protein